MKNIIIKRENIMDISLYLNKEIVIYCRNRTTHKGLIFKGGNGKTYIANNKFYGATAENKPVGYDYTWIIKGEDDWHPDWDYIDIISTKIKGIHKIIKGNYIYKKDGKYFITNNANILYE